MTDTKHNNIFSFVCWRIAVILRIIISLLSRKIYVFPSSDCVSIYSDISLLFKMKRFSKKFRRRLSSSTKKHDQHEELESVYGTRDTLVSDEHQKSSRNNRPTNTNLSHNDITTDSTLLNYSIVNDAENLAPTDINIGLDVENDDLYSSVEISHSELRNNAAACHNIVNNSNNSLEQTNSSKNLITGTSVQQPIMLEFKRLAKKGWYWGPMTREQAEKKLCNTPEASFLVRDSSDDRYLLSLSFRSNSRTLHTRIEHSGMKFSFYEDSPSQSYTSVIELIENSVRDSNEQGVFCYSRSRQPNAQTFPVRLMHPVSRFTEVRPLQDLCRFVIRQYTRIDHIQNLPVPRQIKGYLNQSYF